MPVEMKVIFPHILKLFPVRERWALTAASVSVAYPDVVSVPKHSIISMIASLAEAERPTSPEVLGSQDHAYNRHREHHPPHP